MQTAHPSVHESQAPLETYFPSLQLKQVLKLLLSQEAQLVSHVLHYPEL